MSHPAVCGFTNLPIPGDDVLFMIIKHQQKSNLNYGPFDSYRPATPLIRCHYYDDGFAYLFDEKQIDLLRQSLIGLPGFEDFSFDEIFNENHLSWDELPDGYFPWFIRADVFDDLLPTLEFEDWIDMKIVNSPITVLEERAHEQFEKRLSAAVKLREMLGRPLNPDDELKDIATERTDILSFAFACQTVEKTPTDPYARNGFFPLMGLNHTLWEMLRFGEGGYAPALDHMRCRAHQIETGPEPFTIEDLRKVTEGFYGILRVFMAMQTSRRAFFPHYGVGSQCFEPANLIKIADFVKQVCEKEKAEEEDEEDEG